MKNKEEVKEEPKSFVTQFITEEGNFKFYDCLNLLDARIKTIYGVIDEIKEVLQGQAAWSKETAERLQKISPKIDIVSVDEARNILKG